MTTHTGIRTRILEHIADSGMSTSAELALALGVNKKTILDNAGTARAEGYLTSQRDDVTGHMGYVLTAKGKARVKNGHQTIGNGKSLMENVQACAERDAESRIDVVAPEVTPAAPGVTPVAPHIAPVVTAATEEEAPPAADPALLAMANRMLQDRLAGVAHVLRGCGLDALREIEDGSDMQMHAAALAGAYQMAVGRNDDFMGVIQKSNALLQSKREEVETLRAVNVGMRVDLTAILKALDVSTHEEAIEAIRALNQFADERDRLRAELASTKQSAVEIPVNETRTANFGYACMLMEGVSVHQDKEAAEESALRSLSTDPKLGNRVAVVAILGVAENAIVQRWRQREMAEAA
jgi:hypothetical protein